MTLFGDDPFGWRMLSTVMGTLTVAAVFWIALAIFGDAKLSFTAGILTILNQLVFVQARIAMLDVYMGAFLLLALALFIGSYEARTPRRAHLGLLFSGLLFGLAIGSKWAAAPYFLAAILGFLLLRVRRAKRAKLGPGPLLRSTTLGPWLGVSTLRGLACLAATGVVTYLLTFAPTFFVGNGRLSLSGLLPQQLEIYRLQTQPLAPHNYMSAWWQWPQIGRPIWYLYERVGGVMRGVLLVGNPAIMWGGIVAVLACLAGGIRGKDRRLLLTAGLFLFSYGIWILIPKSPAFYYYYYVPAIFLSIALAAAFARFCRRGLARLVPPLFLTLSALLFVYFYPIISASPLEHETDFLKWMWFENWK